MMRNRIYVETTIPSYLCARPSNIVTIAGKQEVTRQWWEEQRHRFDLYISQFVIDEAERGDPDLSRLRLACLEGIPLLAVDEGVGLITDAILSSSLIPKKAATDAAHIAVAARHGMDYLVTWNCRHIANAEIISRMTGVLAGSGYSVPVICTPDELFGGQNDDE